MMRVTPAGALLFLVLTGLLILPGACRTVSPEGDAEERADAAVTDATATDASPTEDAGLAQLQQDLVLHLAFEGRDSLLDDSSGWGNHGVLFDDPVWSEGYIGFSFPSPSTAWGCIICRQYQADGYDPGDSYVMLVGRTAHLQCNRAASDPGSIPFARWTHVACASGPDGVTLFIDGEPVHQAPAFDMMLDDNPVVIGAGENYADDTKSEHFHGVIDDVRVYTRTLSDAEVRALHALGGG